MAKDHRNGSAADRGGSGDRSRHPKRRKDEEEVADGADHPGGGSGGSDSQSKRRRQRGKEKRRSASSESESGSDSEEEEEEEEERRRRRRRRERRRREREEEKKRRRRKEKEKEKKRRRLEKEKKEKKEKERGKKGAVTNSWGKYGVIRETDMWNKRPEFTAWLAEIKQVNLESLSNWEEKQLFKEFMEDHNTATFPSKKYYSLDAYHQRMMEKEIKRGFKKTVMVERTEFNDEEQRRQELMREREKHKEEQVNVLKRAMSAGMAQAMKEQAQLREEMAYQYKIGNYEAAAAIQRRLDPDAPPG